MGFRATSREFPGKILIPSGTGFQAFRVWGFEWFRITGPGLGCKVIGFRLQGLGLQGYMGSPKKMESLVQCPRLKNCSLVCIRGPATHGKPKQEFHDLGCGVEGFEFGFEV